jgi:hypothetical protein
MTGDDGVAKEAIMTRTSWGVALAAVVGGSALMAAAAEVQKPREDDLSVVKRAVAMNQASVAPARAETGVKTVAAPAVRGREPRWFKVRVVDKGTRKNKVTVNLPLALVRVLGDDVPLDWRCAGGDGPRCSINLSEVLAALEAGQDIVQVDDEESEVRVWVE